MRNAAGLVLAALALAPAWVGCDDGLPFEGGTCRKRAEQGLHVGVAQLLAVSRTADATLVLWRSREGSSEGPLWLSLRSSAGWRAPIALDARSSGLRRWALTAHDVFAVRTDPTLQSMRLVDPDAGLLRPANVRPWRFDGECEEHPGDPFDLDSSAQLALDGQGRAMLAWGEQGSIEARLVHASGEVEGDTVSEHEGALAELRGLTALARGGFVLAVAERGPPPRMHARLLTARFYDGAWQPPQPHSDDVELSSLVAVAGGGMALAWSSWDGARAELSVRRSAVGESWRDAVQVHASSERIDELRLVASHADGRLAAVWRQGGALFAQLLDENGAIAGPGRLACDCELAGAALALDELGALVIVRPRAGSTAELLRFDGWAFERGVELGDEAAELAGALLAAAPDGRLTAVYVELGAAGAPDAARSQRIMAVELARGRPGRATPILAR